MRSYADDLCTYLATVGRGTVGTSLFRILPEDWDPSQLVRVVTATAGPASTQMLDLPRVQITCRSTSFAAAEAEALAMFEALNRIGPIIIGGGTLLQSCYAVSSPFHLGQDSSDCWRFVCNYQLEIHSKENQGG